MSMIRVRQCGAAAVLIATLAALMVARGSAQAPTPAALIASRGSAQAPTPAANNLDPKVLAYKLPDQIPWKDDPIGHELAVLQGDPFKPGLYALLVKWTP